MPLKEVEYLDDDAELAGDIYAGDAPALYDETSEVPVPRDDSPIGDVATESFLRLVDPGGEFFLCDHRACTPLPHDGAVPVVVELQ
jgi:hypothetical protein